MNNQLTSVHSTGGAGGGNVTGPNPNENPHSTSYLEDEYERTEEGNRNKSSSFDRLNFFERVFHSSILSSRIL